MWADAVAALDRHCAALAALGVDAPVRMRPGTALYAHTTGAEISLSLPDTSDRGRLQALLLSGVLGLDEHEVRALFEAMVGRLVAHELGHALRFVRGRMTDDPLTEEHAAEALAAALAPSDAAISLLRRVVAHGGMLGEAAALHRHRDVLAPRFGMCPSIEADRAFSAVYHRDLHRFTHVLAAWTFLDLTEGVRETLPEVVNAWL